MCKEINYRLTIAISQGKIQCVRDLVDTYGLSYSRGWSEGYVLLVQAISQGHTEIAKLLLMYGCKVNSKNKQSSNTPLRLAITNGFVEIVEMLLHRGADIHFTDTCGSTVLHTAIQQGNTEIIHLLLNRGANVCAVDNNGQNPLYLAVIRHRETVVKLLLERGAKVDAQDKDGNTILHLIVKIGFSTIVEDLLKYHPDINNQSNRTLLKTAVCGSTESHKKIVENLLQHGFIVYPEDVDKPEFLHNAVAKGYSKIVEDLLKYGADVNMSDDSEHGYGRTPLHIAVIHTQEEVAKLLLKYGANVNAKDKSGKSSVFYAVEKSNAIITRLFLTNGADIKYDSGLLHTAVAKGCLEIVDDLLKYGADVNMSDDSEHGYGRTPLHIAAMRTQEEVAKLLVNYGANVNAKDKIGRTPVFDSVQNSDAKITKLFLTNGADIEYDSGLLDSAVARGNLEIIEDLLKYGADVNVISKDRTPLECAMFDGKYVTICLDEVVMLLKKHIAMLQVVGLYVSERNLQFMINDYEFTLFQHECEREIEIMKCEKISNSYVSFYDILTKNIHQLAIYAKNENIVQAFKSVDYYSKFPMYASMVAGKFRKGLERKELMELGNQFIHSFFKSILDLPLLCIEKILSYLSNYDLKLIIQKSCLNR